MTETDSQSASILDDFEINTYTVTVPVILEEFDSYEELELCVVETAAKSIADAVDHVDEGDVPYVSTKVDLNSDELEELFDEDADDVEVIAVETKTKLGITTKE